MPRDIVEPTRIDKGDGPLGGIEETHPAFGLIGASRVQSTGAVLFDSDIRHHHFVTVKIATASRRRDLNRDWLHREKEIIEVAMSEAQWASFVSSMNSGSGVPCTIEYRQGEGMVPGMPYEPRLQESMDEVKGAADKAVKEIRERFAAVDEAFEGNMGKKELRSRIRGLYFAIEHMPANMKFAAESLSEHTENVVQKARADIEAMVTSKAQQLGIEPGDLTDAHPLLTTGDEERP